MYTSSSVVSGTLKPPTHMEPPTQPRPAARSRQRPALVGACGSWCGRKVAGGLPPRHRQKRSFSNVVHLLWSNSITQKVERCSNYCIIEKRKHFLEAARGCNATTSEFVEKYLFQDISREVGLFQPHPSSSSCCSWRERPRRIEVRRISTKHPGIRLVDGFLVGSSDEDLYI